MESAILDAKPGVWTTMSGRNDAPPKSKSSFREILFHRLAGARQAKDELQRSFVVCAHLFRYTSIHSTQCHKKVQALCGLLAFFVADCQPQDLFIVFVQVDRVPCHSFAVNGMLPCQRRTHLQERASVFPCFGKRRLFLSFVEIQHDFGGML